MVSVASDRRRPQTTLALQVLEEPWQLGGERQRPMTPAANEPGKHDLKHLLQRTSDLTSDPAVSGAARIKTLGNPLDDKRLDLLGQLPDASGTARPGELAEGNKQRHTRPNALSPERAVMTAPRVGGGAETSG